MKGFSYICRNVLRMFGNDQSATSIKAAISETFVGCSFWFGFSDVLFDSSKKPVQCYYQLLPLFSESSLIGSCVAKQMFLLVTECERFITVFNRLMSVQSSTKEICNDPFSANGRRRKLDKEFRNSVVSSLAKRDWCEPISEDSGNVGNQSFSPDVLCVTSSFQLVNSGSFINVVTQCNYSLYNMMHCDESSSIDDDDDDDDDLFSGADAERKRSSESSSTDDIFVESTTSQLQTVKHSVSCRCADCSRSPSFNTKCLHKLTRLNHCMDSNLSAASDCHKQCVPSSQLTLLCDDKKELPISCFLPDGSVDTVLLQDFMSKSSISIGDLHANTDFNDSVELFDNSLSPGPK